MSDAKSGLTALMSDRGTAGYAANLDWLTGRGGAGEQADATRLLTLSDALAANSNATALLNAAIQAQADAVAANTKAVTTTSRQSGGESTAASVAKTVANGFLGGLTLAPLVRGIFSLFGGGDDSSSAPVLPKYEAPASVDMTAGVTSTSNSPVAVDYDQTGRARAVQAAASPSQITVNVQAMDSQSFLDRSDDIARAVKKAMLESSSLNDVIAEL